MSRAVPARGLTLESKTFGALPIVNHFLKKIGLQELLETYLPGTDKRLKLSAGRGIALLVRNVMVARKPLYALGGWAQPFEPAVLDLAPRQITLLNDDRIGRCLDRLFDADRSSLVMAVVVAAVRAYHVRLDQLHNDSTTVSFAGKYLQAKGHKVRGKPTLRITYGHSKARRPDLKQLLYELTVSNDGAIPVHYQVHDGNKTDDQTHRKTWDILKELTGRADFLYVADSKLCTETNLRHIADHGGTFITVLPKTRREEQAFRDWIQTHDVPWKALWSRRNSRGQSKPKDVYRGYESQQGSAEGFRIFWYHSSEKQRQDQLERQDKLDRVDRALQALRDRLGSKRTRLRTREHVDKLIEEILLPTGTHAWIDVQVIEKDESRYRQSRPGRPGPKTTYQRRLRHRLDFTWTHRQDKIAYDAKMDGIFPLITNAKALSVRRVLRIYKRQPRIEKRHEQLKSVHDVAPQYLKGPARIEALLCVFFLALLLDALMEREVRRNMRKQKIKSLPLYPEQRDCRFPTTDRILELFEGVQVHRLHKKGADQTIFAPKLSVLQTQILQLLGVKGTRYIQPLA
jgi:transposase